MILAKKGYTFVIFGQKRRSGNGQAQRRFPDSSLYTRCFQRFSFSHKPLEAFRWCVKASTGVGILLCVSPAVSSVIQLQQHRCALLLCKTLPHRRVRSASHVLQSCTAYTFLLCSTAVMYYTLFSVFNFRARLSYLLYNIMYYTSRA